LDKKHTVFGNLVGGEDVLDTLEKIPIKAGTERPAQPVRITDIIMSVLFSTISNCSHCSRRSYQDPFEEYKIRQEKRRARKAQAEEEARIGVKAEKKDGDNMNWFGTKLGEGGTSEGSGSGGVGKYLGLKRPLHSPSVAPARSHEEGQKKRRLGFGDFEGW
jgi:peptidyl-prolyl cis-trans isomerase-like 2